VILVDTDVVIDILRGYPAAEAWLDSLGGEEFALCGFVAAELVQGCANRDDQRRVVRFLTAYQVIWPSADTCDRALGVFSEHHLARGIGIFDALVGQTAVEMRVPLHTFNTKHYSCIRGLRTVQPYKRRS
jgi:predicted nucleic acid-binding protein